MRGTVRWQSAIKAPEWKSCQFEENALCYRKPVKYTRTQSFHVPSFNFPQGKVLGPPTWGQSRTTGSRYWNCRKWNPNTDGVGTRNSSTAGVICSCWIRSMPFITWYTYVVCPEGIDTESTPLKPARSGGGWLLPEDYYHYHCCYYRNKWHLWYTWPIEEQNSARRVQ